MVKSLTARPGERLCGVGLAGHGGKEPHGRARRAAVGVGLTGHGGKEPHGRARRAACGVGWG